ncbi:hypothetical protein HNQ59_000674 [Chitinivorax tropicus]|uniref:Lysis protein n=1 Tax=Chitinivorax tropicus TaxID=714531 RepID=A0A840MG84_9PROT|nr:hypothetical protein [Chitinivorax tropicus]MBB5017410.1 hypothetical protein [Chitinivorax tropicus]
MNLLSLPRPGLWYMAAAVLLSAGAGFTMGYRQGKQHAEHALITLQKQHADALLAATQNALAEQTRLHAEADWLQAALSKAQVKHASQAQYVKERINDVTQVYRPALAQVDTPQPRCVFTRGFMRLWNRAIGADLPATPFTDEPADPTDAADAVDAGLQPADLLAHLADYGQYCRNLAAQTNGLIDWTLETNQKKDVFHGSD